MSGGTLSVLTNNMTLGSVGGSPNGVANLSGTSIINVTTGGVFLPENQIELRRAESLRQQRREYLRRDGA